MLHAWQSIRLGCLALAFCTLAVQETPTRGQSATTQANANVPAREALRKNPIPADAGSLLTGKQIYAGNCAPCHGATGRGNGTVAGIQELPPANLTDSKRAQWSDGTLYWAISNGHRPMPKFDNTLPEESRWNVVNYVRTLIAAPTTASSTAPTTK